jgi:DNA polymerase-3 subunit gamma/tau
MSYVVLARKYRPRNFAEMVGQEHVVRALSHALVSQRLHHAYLFTGTRGVGKTTVSRILAKSLNCVGPDGQGGITAEPCGVCQACRDIDAGRFVDYTELDAASNRGVDEVQALLEQAVYKPVQGRFKVFMIDEVHMLTSTAFNAMLKTLEEPPEYLKFVLATTDPQKVPVTVLSRCLQFNLRPMAPETVAEHLARVLQSEGVSADAQALRLLARAARGSMRDALSLADQAIAFGGGRLLEATVRQMLGAVDRSYVLRLVDALARGDGAAVVDIIDELRVHGLNAASLLEEMIGVLQRMAVLQAVPARAAGPDALGSDPDAVEIARLAQAMPADETQLLYSLCLHGRGELGLAPDEYAALLMVLLRLLAFKPAGEAGGGERKTPLSAERPPATPPRAAPVPTCPPPAPAEPSAAPASARAGVAAVPEVAPAPPAPAPAIAPAAPETHALPPDMPFVEDVEEVPPWDDRPVPSRSAPRVLAVPVRDPGPSSERVEPRRGELAAGPDPSRLVPTPEGDFWYEVVTGLVKVEAITALVRELALQSQLVARTPQAWRLRIERASLAQGTTAERLAAALAEAGHGPVRIETEVVPVGQVTDSPALRNAAEAQRRQREAERSILDDPFVQAMMRDFGGKIVPGTLKADPA